MIKKALFNMKSAFFNSLQKHLFFLYFADSIDFTANLYYNI